MMCNMGCKRLLQIYLLLAAAVLLLTRTGTHAEPEAPESLHRRSCFKLETNRLAQSMWLEGAINHNLPPRFGCSSLEGASCLYDQLPHPHSPTDLSSELLSESTAAVKDKQTRFKLVLLKPQKGENMKEFLQSLEAKAGRGLDDADPAAARLRQQQAQELIAENGQVVFEGDPASVSDVESMAEAMLTALGLPESGRTAATMRRELAKVLTDAEFEQTRKEAERGASATGAAPNGDESIDSGHEAADASADVSKSAGGGGGSGGGSREISGEGASNKAAQRDEEEDADPSSEKDAARALSAEELAVSVRKLLASLRSAQQRQAAAATGEPGVAEPAAGQRPEPPQPLHAGQAGRRGRRRATQQQQHGSARRQVVGDVPEAAATVGAVSERVFVDDETGEQFVLPEEELADGEERVYVDDRTGATYVISDEGDGGSGEGRRGRLSRRLSDSMAWLDGLTDEQYEEYMDNYYQELDQEEAAREEQEHRQAAVAAGR